MVCTPDHCISQKIDLNNDTAAYFLRFYVERTLKNIVMIDRAAHPNAGSGRKEPLYVNAFLMRPAQAATTEICIASYQC